MGKHDLKGQMILHQSPSGFSAQHTALLLAQLSAAFETALKLPDATFPIHITVEMGGKKMCGSISPGLPGMTTVPTDHC